MIKLCLASVLLMTAISAQAAEYTAPPASTEAKAPAVNPAEAAVKPVTRALDVCPAGRGAFECDRQAILAMQGDFRVRFNFDETVVLDARYTRHEPQRSGGYETVVLVRDSSDVIELQHILVGDKGFVTKHWRQQWVYEAPRRWQYMGEQHFGAMDTAPSARAGQWTQFVYEVNDAPRYSGTGSWVHGADASTWTSDATQRPLPRREYTKRQDYQVMRAINRHTITAQGWTHEQDNTKLVRDAGGEHGLVREFGFNDYTRIEGYDFTPARQYWARTAPFWAAVRERWQATLGACRDLTLRYPANADKELVELLEVADGFKGRLVDNKTKTKVQAWFGDRTQCADARVATATP